MNGQEALTRREACFLNRGRELNQFKTGDKVLNANTNRMGIVELVDDDGDVVVNYNQVGLLLIKDLKCSEGACLELVEAVEEDLQEAQR